MTHRIPEFIEFESDIQAIPLIGHVRFFLDQVQQKKIQLTEIEAITPESMHQLSTHIPAPNEGWPSDDMADWPYLEFIDGLCHGAQLTQNRKGEKVLTKAGKEFVTASPEVQLLVLFQTFWQHLDWSFFVYQENEVEPVIRLQDNQNECLHLLVEIGNWCDIPEFCNVLAAKLWDENDSSIKQDRVARLVFEVFLNNLNQFGLVEFELNSDPDVYLGRVRLGAFGHRVSTVVLA